MHRVAGITSNTVPWEILRAGGYSPRLMDAQPGPTPFANRFMEDVFDGRIRMIFDRLCAGEWSDVDVVVIPRTSEQEHKLYLYLREVSRLRYSESIPKLYLYNLLHTRYPESYDYGLERTRQMVRDFDASDDNLWEAIAESNRARAAVRELLQRRKEGLLEGSVALGMIGEFYAGSRENFVAVIQTKLRSTPPAHPGTRPRILIKGAPLDHTGLHRLVEQRGGYVAAEDDWRGSRAAGDIDIRNEGDPVVEIFEKYFYDTVSPRVCPADKADLWFHRVIEQGEVDGVLFYISTEDDVVGWDYPRHLAFLESHRMPSLLVRESAATEPREELIAPVAAFVKSLRRG